MKFIFIFSASEKSGLGHFSRALSFTRYLQRKGIDCDIVHLGLLSENVSKQLKSYANIFNQKFTEVSTLFKLDELFLKKSYTHVLVDVPEEFNHSFWGISKYKFKSVIATFDDLSDFRKEADLCFYPPAIKFHNLDWGGFRGEKFEGFEYYIYRPELDDVNCCQVFDINYDLCITCGGSDANLLTFEIIDQLNSFSDLKLLAILGPLVNYQEQKVCGNLTIMQNPPNYIDLIKKSDLIINTFGVSLYELAYLKKKVLSICLKNDHIISSEVFAEHFGIEFMDVADVKNHLITSINKLRELKLHKSRTNENSFTLNESILFHLRRKTKI